MMSPMVDADGPVPQAAVSARLHHVRAGQLTCDTAQTASMQRFEAVAGKSVGSTDLWMGQTHMAPATSSADHHHGPTETAIYVVSGHPRFVFLQDGLEVALDTSPGDYVFVPPWVPHREENPSADREAVVVIARSSQEAVVVNLPDLSG